ncbi:unnamed protein product [Phytophthora lilii]|uniref:Unnamed protein product n=1 Tax=Phytophthora lilii TaxID=2077276 RepID=A0A9W6X355_9STRA|nr:unnamed protein product [Phytophthora lilii]
MHQRVRRYLEIANDLHSKLMDIKRLDFYKSELIKIGGSNRAFRSIIDSPLFRDQVEALFDMSADEAQDEYDQLLEKRNALVHPFLSGIDISMYPNFNNQQDRESKHQALLARIARDQRLEAIKKEAYANAIWATDSEQSKLKDATETGDTLARLMAAMKSNQSTSTTGVGDIYEKMSDGAQETMDKNRARMGMEDRDAAPPNPNAGVFDAGLRPRPGPKGPFSSIGDAYDAMGDIPMLEEKFTPMEEVSTNKGEKAGPVDRSNPIRDDIISMFKRNPYLSNHTFRPVIVKEGQHEQHEYIIKATDGEVAFPDGRKVPTTNKLLSYVDWNLTRDAIFDKVSKFNNFTFKLKDVMEDARDKNTLRQLFKRWRAITPMYAYGDQSTVVDDVMDDLNISKEEKSAFEAWVRERGFDPEQLDSESKKRALEDSTVSLDTRVNDMKFHNVADDEEIIDDKRLMKINRQVDWAATLNYVLGELSSGLRALNLDAGKETDPKEQSLKYIRIQHILDMIKIVDPKQGSQDDELLKFETPAPRGRKVSKGISPAKKDYVFEPPSGKGLAGRGLRGAGILKKNRSYNLADIEGSGKASDLKYKRLGSKFIRKADLNSNRLKLVFPNRTSVGPIRTMSNELTEMVKDLLYNDNINQQAYRALSIDDQRVFYEIVKKTHVEHTLQTPMADPRLTLRAEFDKMRGEIALGNDNPDMLRELYRLATDMFEQKMLSSKEFRMKDPVVDTPKQHPSPDWIHGKKAGATVWANEPKERKPKTFKL